MTQRLHSLLHSFKLAAYHRSKKKFAAYYHRLVGRIKTTTNSPPVIQNIGFIFQCATIETRINPMNFTVCKFQDTIFKLKPALGADAIHQTSVVSFLGNFEKAMRITNKLWTISCLSTHTDQVRTGKGWIAVIEVPQEKDSSPE
jgi:hypothetical protein